MLVIDSVVLPVLVRVMLSAALGLPTSVAGKVRLVGDNWTCVPVPYKLADCGLPPPLSATESEAVRTPVAAGVKVTLTVQLELAATEEPQVLALMLKSDAFVPPIEMLVIVTAVLPRLLTVTV
jgi:hypothetical protein